MHLRNSYYYLNQGNFSPVSSHYPLKVVWLSDHSSTNTWRDQRCWIQCVYSVYISIDPTFASYSFAVLCSLNVNLLLIFLGRKSFIDPICCSFLHGFAHVSKGGFVHPIFSLWDINVTLRLLPPRGHVIWRDSVSVWVHVKALKQSVREFYGRASLFVAPYWRAPKRAKLLPTATTPLCFWFFRCRVDVLQS